MTKSLVNSLYFHFPFCRHLCNYCDFYKRKTDGIGALDIKQFSDRVISYFKANQRLLESEGFELAPLETLYFGGGTPSLWDIEGATFWDKRVLGKTLELQKDCEWTMEVNPGSFTKHGIEAWRSMGVNRFSLGIQTLNEKCLPYLDRVHDLEDVDKALRYFANLDVSYSVDFMLGIPHSQNIRDIEAELTQILEFGPKHISLYILTVPEHYKYYENLPDENWVEDEFLQTSDFLRSRGFLHYEVSNFAKPGLESRHNLKYWENASVVAIGPSATGLLRKGEDRATRYKWKVSGTEYELEKLDREKLTIENVYLNLRTQYGLDQKMLSHIEGARFTQVVEKWSKRGYLTKKSPLQLSPKGYLMLDSIMDDIFRVEFF